MWCYSEGAESIRISFSEEESKVLLQLNAFSRKRLIMISVLHSLSKAGLGRYGRSGVRIRYKNGRFSVLITRHSPIHPPFAVTADEETLTELLRQLFLNGCDGTCLSSLYLYKGEYRLIIVPLIGSELPHHICSEYMADISSGKNVRCIQEDGIPVCINDVIGKLGGLEERL